MGEETSIGWTTSTINVWHGCEKVSLGCRNCYAEVSTPVRVKRAGHEAVEAREATDDAPAVKARAARTPLELWGAHAARDETKGWEANLRKWQAARARMHAHPHVGPNVVPGRPWFVFGQSLSDTFEDYTGGRVLLADGTVAASLDGLRARFFAAIEACPALTFQLLTKRPENVVRMVPPRWLETLAPGACPHCGDPAGDVHREAECRALCGVRTGSPGACQRSHIGWPAHVWIGATVEDQANADERIPHLLRIPAAVRFLSVEPQLGPVSLNLCTTEERSWANAGRCPIAWVIQGFESGHKARHGDLAWARSLRDQCAAAGIAYFLKQLDGGESDEARFPPDLRGCRAFPPGPVAAA